jgi:hypothetical protein
MQYLENLEHNSTREEINNRYYLRSDVIDVSDYRPVRLAYQPPASSTFLSEQTSHQQPASILSSQNNQHQPPAKRTGCTTTKC